MMIRARLSDCDDQARRLHAIHLRHPHVHQHDVRSQPRGGGDRLATVAGLAEDRHVGLGVDHHPECHPHQLLVVGQEQARAHRRAPSASGFSRRCTRQPPSGLGPASSLPP